MLEEVTRDRRDRARRVGHRTPRDTHPLHLTTHSSPLQGLTGPASLSGLLLAR